MFLFLSHNNNFIDKSFISQELSISIDVGRHQLALKVVGIQLDNCSFLINVFRSFILIGIILSYCTFTCAFRQMLNLFRRCTYLAPNLLFSTTYGILLDNLFASWTGSFLYHNIKKYTAYIMNFYKVPRLDKDILCFTSQRLLLGKINFGLRKGYLKMILFYYIPLKFSKLNLE